MDAMGFSFFFSSRRRHTRYWRDWSSDVCSSDLDVAVLRRIERVRGEESSVLAREPDGRNTRVDERRHQPLVGRAGKRHSNDLEVERASHASAAAEARLDAVEPLQR